MKKIIAYTSAAVLLGIVIMLFPLRLFYSSHGEEGPVIGSAPYFVTLEQSPSYRALVSPEKYGYPESFTPPLDAENVTTQPTDPFVEISALSFFIALVIYLLFRRRRPDSSYRYSQFPLRP